MIISLVAAAAKNGVIGKNNDLPWRLPDDMKFFMETTKGHYVIMGRKNYDSIPTKFRPLPDRTNLVVTRQKAFKAEGCIVLNSLEDAITLAKEKGEKELMIIGGAEIYKQSLPYTHRIYLTEIDAIVDGDVYFPDFDKKEWKEVSRIHHSKDEKHKYAFDFVTYEKRNQ